jgi:hypothetical protein
MIEAGMMAGVVGMMKDAHHIGGAAEDGDEGKGEGMTTIGIVGTTMGETGIEDGGTMMTTGEVGEVGAAGVEAVMAEEEEDSMTVMTVGEMVMGLLRVLPPADIAKCPQLQLLTVKRQHLLRFVAVLCDFIALTSRRSAR